MYKRIHALKDAYITDKIVNSARHDRSNTGQASTLDIFKLYGVNKSGSSSLTELSRALIKFDLDEIRKLTGSNAIIPSHPSFKCYLTLRDVYGGQPTPASFTIFVAPMSRSWAEGAGNDVVFFNDIDAVNFVTAAFSNGAPVAWHLSGANKAGLLGSDDIDYILSGNLSDGQGVTALTASQYFTTGYEDLSIDVTRLISATLANQIPDEGFRISFTSEEEDDAATRFVKRFASSNTSDESLTPRLIVLYDDSVQDNQLNSFFDVQNTLFLYNYDRDGFANLTSASLPVTGSNCLLLKLLTDSPDVAPSGGIYQLHVTASQHIVGGQQFTGLYSASFTIPSTHAELRSRIALSQSIEFTQVWSSLDDTLGFLTQSSYVIRSSPRSTYNRSQASKHVINVTNMRSSYAENTTARFRLFVDDDDPVYVVKPRKLPFENKGTAFNRAYYSVRNAYTNTVVIPFETSSNATRVSCDGKGMYFDVDMRDLAPGSIYEIDLLVEDNGTSLVYTNIGSKFRVDKA